MSGFFLGGIADSMQQRAELGIKQDTLAADTGLRTRALDIQEQGQKNAMQRDMLTRVDSQVSDAMGKIGEMITEFRAANVDLAKIEKAIRGPMESTMKIAGMSGRDPEAIKSQIMAQLLRPTGVEAAAAVGKGKAASAIAEEEATKAAGYDGLGKWKTHDEKVKAEGALRDDYMKQAAPFIVIRDFYSSMQTAEKSGAGDITRVYSFMKMQDPNSAVLPGEYATAANSAGVPETIRAMYNKMVGGGVLGDGARKELESQAKKIYEQRGLQHDKLSTTFSDIAKRHRLDPNNVIPNLLPATRPDPLGIR